MSEEYIDSTYVKEKLSIYLSSNYYLPQIYFLNLLGDSYIIKYQLCLLYNKCVIISIEDNLIIEKDIKKFIDDYQDINIKIIKIKIYT